MRLRASLAALAATLLCLPASAQVSLTSANLYPFAPNQPAMFDNYTSNGSGVPAADEVRIDALIGLTGANQTWDFTQIAFPNQIGTTFTYFTDLASLPGAANFPSANAALGAAFTFSGPTPGQTSYTYARASGAAYTAIGFYIPPSPESNNIETLNTYDAGGLTQFTFPFTSGTTVADETVVTAVSPVQQTFTLAETRTVLGYGTLVTPLGTAPCLMFREESRQTIDGTVASLLIRYFWRTPSESIGAIASNQQFTPGVPTYTAFHSILRSGGTASEGTPSVSATLALSAAPNPVRGTASVRLTAFAPLGSASVAVTDVLGREVARLQDGPLAAGEHAFPLDASGLAPGVYVVRVQAGAQSVSTRLSVVR